MLKFSQSSSVYCPLLCPQTKLGTEGSLLSTENSDKKEAKPFRGEKDPVLSVKYDITNIQWILSVTLVTEPLSVPFLSCGSGNSHNWLGDEDFNCTQYNNTMQCVNVSVLL